MEFLVIFITGLLSAFLSDFLPVVKNTNLIFKLQVRSISVIYNKELIDEQKRKILLSNSGKILCITIKLVLYFFIVFLPFSLLVFIGNHFTAIAFEKVLLSFLGILIITVAFLGYHIVKRGYGSFRL